MSDPTRLRYEAVLHPDPRLDLRVRGHGFASVKERLDLAVRLWSKKPVPNDVHQPYAVLFDIKAGRRCPQAQPSDRIAMIALQLEMARKGAEHAYDILRCSLGTEARDQSTNGLGFSTV